MQGQVPCPPENSSENRTMDLSLCLNPDSKIRKLFEEVYEEREGKKPEIIAVHAGIECGIFIEKIPGLDAISIGPDMFDVHTPNEHVSIPSMLNNWEYFTAVLGEVK